MNSIPIQGVVDSDHQLVVSVPDSVPPGPITVWIQPASDEDEAGSAWADGVAQSWAEDLGDAEQDIYTLTDGEPVDETT